MTHPQPVPHSTKPSRPSRSPRTIAEEHRLLRNLLSEIEAAFKGKAPRRNSGLDVVALRLDTLRGPLAAHFDEEERAGFFEKVEERAPEHSADCARLRAEHRGLLVRLDALRAVSPEKRRDAGWSLGVRTLLVDLSDHEARESDLLMRSLDGTGGAPD
jgi:hypothetical protein